MQRVFSREEASKIELVKGQLWESRGGDNILEILNVDESYGIIEYKINDWLQHKEAPRIQIQLGILRAEAKLI